MQHTPAPELDEETIEAAAARVAAMNLSADKPSFAAEITAIREETKDLPPLDTPTHDKPSAPSMQAINSILGRERKPRSDRGVQRGPKAPGEPEVAAPSETHAISITITAIQYADLEREAEKILAQVGIAHSYLLAPPAEILLHARVQKHWRTLVGK